MFIRSIIHLALALIIVVASLLLVTSFTVTAAAPTADARPSADLIVNPGESIQAAIDAANDGDTIIINAGNYTESLTLSKPVSLTGVNSDTTIIHAVAGQRVLTVTGATISNSVVVSGLTFMDGQADIGAGLLITDGAQPVILGIIARGNRATNYGGGLYAAGALTMTNSQLIDNWAYANGFGYGGGVYAAGPVVIVQSQFISNVSPYGAGVYSAQVAEVSATDFIGNLATNGAGLNGAGDLAVRQGLFAGNLASGGGGSAISADQLLIVTGTHFVDNLASEEGGAIFAYHGPVIMTQAQFTNNRTTFKSGGAVYVYGGRLSVTASRFISNSAYASGGAIYTNDVGDLSDTDFISNTAHIAGGAAVLLATSIVSDVYLQRNYCLGNGCTGGGLQLGVLVTPAMQFEIRQSRFISNGADYGGGFNATGVVTISDSAFTGNGAYTGGGGEVHGSAHVLNSRFDSNFGSGSSSMGGGLFVSGETVISRTVFQNNRAVNTGGGLRTEGPATVFDSQFIANRSSNSAGGGLSAVNAITLEQTDFLSNTAFGPGGGVIAFGPATLLSGRFENNTCLSVGCFGGGLDAIRDLAITGTQFVSNSATYWGGALYREQLGDSRIVNAVFARNHSTLDGAAIYLKATGNTVILHTTLADVSSNPTSAIAIVAGMVSLTNTILVNHAVGVRNASGQAAEDYTLFNGNLVNAQNVVTGSHSLIGEPRFIDWGRDDYRLLPDSIAIERGVDAGVYTDLDGLPRPIGPGFDLGAYEFRLIQRTYLPLLRK